MNTDFWNKKNVFITGHTGFKGSWLCLWLTSMGAKVTGYALAPPTEPSLFDLCRIDDLIHSIRGDVRNFDFLYESISKAKPEIIIHMAAQPLVRVSYVEPVETYDINVMGTINVLEAARSAKGLRAFINVTTDKCYENREWFWGYRENEPLGGDDPYSNSKACSELVTKAYRNSFFNPLNYKEHKIAVATVRAGNVIGGGDWAKDRLVPDTVNAALAGKKIKLRNPNAVRPWQFVLEPLSGYLTLAENLCSERGDEFSESWNFGPDEADAKSVEWIVKRLSERLGGNGYLIDKGEHPHEATYLKLDCSKAKSRLNWLPKWTLGKAIESIVEWTAGYKDGNDLRGICLKQIFEYMASEVIERT